MCAPGRDPRPARGWRLPPARVAGRGASPGNAERARPRSGPIMLQPSERRLFPANHKTGPGTQSTRRSGGASVSQSIVPLNSSRLPALGPSPPINGLRGEPADPTPTALGSWVEFCFTLFKEKRWPLASEKYCLQAGSGLSQLLAGLTPPRTPKRKGKRGPAVAARLPFPGAPRGSRDGPCDLREWGGGAHFDLRGKARTLPNLSRLPREFQAPHLLFSPRWVLTHQRKAVRIQRASGPHPTAPPSPPLATLWNGLSDQGI